MNFSFVITFSPSQVIAREHSINIATAVGRNKIYLYFPTTTDNSFPDFSTLITATPANAFDVADLDSSIGTTADLRDNIYQVVVQNYKEFDVSVSKSTILPGPTDARWQIVAIGSDSKPYGTGVAFGVAEDVDIDDSNAQDYARVWAGSFVDTYGGTGEPLEGVKSTLERWAMAIGETTAHEAGHNYGLGHGDAYPRAGSAEDNVNNHTMATYSTGLDGETRAGLNRHFSDTSYEILGHNIGLNTKTIHNWDFINPNDQDGYGLRMKILSKANTLTLSRSFTGSASPWDTPTVSALGTTEVFQQETEPYNVFELVYDDAKSWDGPIDGVVQPGESFHVGASFNEADAFIVTESRLLHSDVTSELPLSPRICGYDAGEIDLSTGEFIFRFFAIDRRLFLRDIFIREIPRMIDINTMIEGVEPIGMNGLPITVIKTTAINDTEILPGESLTIPIGELTDPRHIDLPYGEYGNLFDTSVGEIPYDPNGIALSLFPSTYIYITATVVDPEATFYNSTTFQNQTGPLESKLFYQFAGIKPDFNDNGIDDLIDIRVGTSNDTDENGIPDEVDFEEPTFGFPLFYSFFALFCIVALLGSRKRR